MISFPFLSLFYFTFRARRNAGKTKYRKLLLLLQKELPNSTAAIMSTAEERQAMKKAKEAEVAAQNGTACSIRHQNLAGRAARATP